jgi:hypothetical protein
MQDQSGEIVFCDIEILLFSKVVLTELSKLVGYDGEVQRYW